MNKILSGAGVDPSARPVRQSRVGSTWQAYLVLLCLTVLAVSASLAGPKRTKAEILQVEQIWDRAPHNAFTDLIRFKRRWFCVFREGQGHVSPDGSIRIITSRDGEQWKSAALLQMDGSDLRDAKFSRTPDGQLLLVAAGAYHQPAKYRHQTYTWRSDDGFNWGEPTPVGEPNNWLWRVSWAGDEAYGVGYSTWPSKKLVRLYHSSDGQRFEPHVWNLFETDYPNETKLLFLRDGTAYCLLRRDAGKATAQLGISRPPYRHWEWKDLGIRLGGPNMIRLRDGRFLAAGRLYDGGARTSLMWLDPEQGTLTEFLRLPSGGDTSYPGLVMHRGVLWMSYYSSHEGKTKIYLAKIRLPRKVRRAPD